MRTEPNPLDDVAARITAHLQRFAADPAIPLFLYRPEHAGARRVGRRIVIKYTGRHHGFKYGGPNNYTQTADEARAYLAWLDAGNVGKHYDVPNPKRTFAALQAICPPRTDTERR